MNDLTAPPPPNPTKPQPHAHRLGRLKRWHVTALVAVLCLLAAQGTLDRAELSTLSAESLSSQPASTQPSILERFKRFVDLGAASAEVQSRMGQLAEVATRATTTLIDLAVVFVLQTAVFPIAFVWLFAYAFKSLLRMRV